MFVAFANRLATSAAHLLSGPELMTLSAIFFASPRRGRAMHSWSCIFDACQCLTLSVLDSSDVVSWELLFMVEARRATLLLSDAVHPM